MIVVGLGGLLLSYYILGFIAGMWWLARESRGGVRAFRFDDWVIVGVLLAPAVMGIGVAVTYILKRIAIFLS